MRIELNKFETSQAHRSREDFARFASEQSAEFAALEDAGDARYSQWGRTLQSAWSSAAAHARNENLSDDQVQAKITQSPCFRIDSEFVQYLENLTARKLHQRVEGAMRYASPANDGNGVGNYGAMNGAGGAAAVIAVQERIGPSSTRKMLKDLLDEHESRLDPLLEKDAADLKAKQEEFETTLTEMNEKFAAFQSEFAEFFSKSRADWLDAYNDYVEQLKTETAVKLWEDRAIAHKTRYDKFFRATWVFGVLGGSTGIFWIFAGYALAIRAFPNSETGQIAAYSAGSIILFTLLIWTLRVLIRSMMSEDHLSIDASARSAMAHTYLALTKEGKASDDDRAIILASLFAPVSDGLVKDDAMPILSPTAIAAAAITNPKN